MGFDKEVQQQSIDRLIILFNNLKQAVSTVNFNEKSLFASRGEIGNVFEGILKEKILDQPQYNFEAQKTSPATFLNNLINPPSIPTAALAWNAKSVYTLLTYADKIGSSISNGNFVRPLLKIGFSEKDIPVVVSQLIPLAIHFAVNFHQLANHPDALAFLCSDEVFKIMDHEYNITEPPKELSSFFEFISKVPIINNWYTPKKYEDWKIFVVYNAANYRQQVFGSTDTITPDKLKEFSENPESRKRFQNKIKTKIVNIVTYAIDGIGYYELELKLRNAKPASYEAIISEFQKSIPLKAKQLNKLLAPLNNEDFSEIMLSGELEAQLITVFQECFLGPEIIKFAGENLDIEKCIKLINNPIKNLQKTQVVTLAKALDFEEDDIIVYSRMYFEKIITKKITTVADQNFLKISDAMFAAISTGKLAEAITRYNTLQTAIKSEAGKLDDYVDKLELNKNVIPEAVNAGLLSAKTILWDAMNNAIAEYITNAINDLNNKKINFEKFKSKLSLENLPPDLKELLNVLEAKNQLEELFKQKIAEHIEMVQSTEHHLLDNTSNDNNNNPLKRPDDTPDDEELNKTAVVQELFIFGARRVVEGGDGFFAATQVAANMTNTDSAPSKETESSPTGNNLKRDYVK